MYHRKYCNETCEYEKEVYVRWGKTDLRCANFVEDYEYEGLHEPCEHQVLSAPTEHQAASKSQGHLRDEARQRRPEEPLPQNWFQSGGGRGVG